MILRVLNHYKDFHCIADRCKDSCCIGWEIDIDPDTHSYYQGLKGELGDRLRASMYLTEEGDYSFHLGEGGRCPFLNQENLCDICAQLGEEAFSEVCTEYPRFSVYYGQVLQKTLALSCEEVGRLVFTNPAPMEITDLTIPGQDFEEDPEEDPRAIRLLEQAQTRLLQILQNRGKTLADRLMEAFAFADQEQEKLNSLDMEETCTTADSGFAANTVGWKSSREAALDRFEVFCNMETLDGEWEEEKEKLSTFLEDESYESNLMAYLTGPDYRETDYEHLLVCFVFRYAMTAALDYNLKGKLILALEFTLMLRDMAACRYKEQGGHLSTEDQIDLARIFSKEVEHSEENVAYAEEEFLFL